MGKMWGNLMFGHLLQWFFWYAMVLDQRQFWSKVGKSATSGGISSLV